MLSNAVKLAKWAGYSVFYAAMDNQMKVKAGKAGGKKRADALSPKRRSEIARKGGKALWDRIRAGTLKSTA